MNFDHGKKKFYIKLIYAIKTSLELNIRIAAQTYRLRIFSLVKMRQALPLRNRTWERQEHLYAASAEKDCLSFGFKL